MSLIEAENGTRKVVPPSGQTIKLTCHTNENIKESFIDILLFIFGTIFGIVVFTLVIVLIK